MDDLKSVTVGYLRELARKHLGSGYSKLKKEELITALAAYVPALAELARLAGLTVSRKRAAAKTAAAAPEPRKAAKAPKTSKAPAAPAKAAASTKVKPAAKVASKTAAQAKAPARAVKEPKAKDVGQGRVSAPKRVAAKRASEKPEDKVPETPSARPAKVVTFHPKPRSEREKPAEDSLAAEPPSTAPRASEPPAPSPPDAPPPPPAEQHPAEPLVEGFFVARLMGEDEARSHHMTGGAPRESVPVDPPEARSGGPGSLPEEYQDDTALLLPRDPYTLFVSWDFSTAARTKALQGLDSPRAVLKVYESEKVVRELEVALESRSYYVHHLTPGRPYRVEAHFVGSDGRSRRIGPSTNRVMLPSTGPSQDTSIRFLRVQSRMPEPQVIPEAVRPRAPEPEEREYISWRRVELPGSAGVRDIPEVRRERDVAAAPETQSGAHLEAPPRPPGASDQRYMDAVERAAGASDQRYLDAVERAAGASDQRYLESPTRAAGASDQRYMQDREHQYLDVGRAPGASDMRYGGTSPSGGAQYLDVGRAPGASDMRYLESPSRAPGASDMRYLESPSRAPGASDMRYLESPPRAPGASDQRYLESPPRAPGASDMRYLESPPRAPGASDMRYLEYVARPPGASDPRHSEAAPAAPGSTEETSSRKPPSGSGHS